MIDFSKKIKGFSADMLINSLEIKSQKQLYKVLMYSLYQKGKKYRIPNREVDLYYFLPNNKKRAPTKSIELKNHSDCLTFAL